MTPNNTGFWSRLRAVLFASAAPNSITTAAQFAQLQRESAEEQRREDVEDEALVVDQGEGHMTYRPSMMGATCAGWKFGDKTLALDLEAATLDELVAALDDCLGCIAVEYPETEEGTHKALEREKQVNEALFRRFPEKADKMRQHCREYAARLGGIAHPRG